MDFKKGNLAAMSRKMLIYWYTTNKPFQDIEPWTTYCLGEVDPYAKKYFGMSNENAVIARIKEELGRSAKDGARIRYSDIENIGYQLVDFPNPKNKENHFDKDVFAVLRHINCRQISTEWFNTSPDEIKRVLRHIETGEPLGGTYTLRARQQEAIDKFKQTIDSNQDRFGLFAMPRFGKTVVSFEMINYLFEKFPDKKYVFFISAKLDAKQAVREDYYKFDRSCKFKLFIYDSDQIAGPAELGTDKWLFFASKQWFDNKSIDDIHKIFPSVNSDDCAAVLFDEAHFSRLTPRATRTIDILNPKVKIDITGTPFRLKSNEDYNDNNSYVYSVLDEAEDFERTTNKKEFRLKNPELIYITPENEFFNTDSSFSDFFDSDGANEQIKKWVKATFWGGKLHIEGQSLNVQNAIVVVPPRKRYCDLFANAVNELARDEHLSIICTRTSTTDEDDDTYISDNELRFREWNRECKIDKQNIHLLVTIGKGLQAVSFPDCHSVIMISDMTSPESYIQAAFRCKTPNGVKTEAYVIDYNKGRTLQMIDTFIKNHLYVRACDNNYKQEYEKALSTIQIRDHTLTRQNYTFEEIFNTFTSSWKIEKITDSVDFDIARIASKIDLSNVKLSDLQKPHALQLQLSDRGDDYEELENQELGLHPTEDKLNPSPLEANFVGIIEQLKDDLVKYGYVPWNMTENDRIRGINRSDIQQRELPVGKNNEMVTVWSYIGGTGNADDIYIDEFSDNPSAIRWKYLKNRRFVKITGEKAHGEGTTNEKKVRAFVNAVVRYLPAYFLVSGVPNGFDDFVARFGRRNHAENYIERQLFRKFIGIGIDYRYIIEILQACDAGSREQIIAFCNAKVNKCFDKNGNIIPAEVLKLPIVYKKDGSRPVPQELATKMRKNGNYDIVVCGGYYLTDDTTKMYITDNFSDAEIMKKLRPNIMVIYSDNILETLDNNKDTIMKFQSFIMNPPYGKLHLPILQKMVDLIVKNGGIGVSLQPIKWLQDKYRSDHEKYRDLRQYCANITYLSAKDASAAFNILQEHDMGIYHLAPSDDSCPFDCNVFLAKTNTKDRFIMDYEHQGHPKEYENQPYFVAVRKDGHMDRWWTYLLVNYMGAIINGKTDEGLTPQEAYYSNPQTNHNKQVPKILGFEFNTEQEARNFVHNSKLLPVIAAMILIKDGRANPFDVLPKIPVDKKYNQQEMEKYLGFDGLGIDYSKIECFTRPSGQDEWEPARNYMEQFA